MQLIWHDKDTKLHVAHTWMQVLALLLKLVCALFPLDLDCQTFNFHQFINPQKSNS